MFNPKPQDDFRTRMHQKLVANYEVKSRGLLKFPASNVPWSNFDHACDKSSRLTSRGKRGNENFYRIRRLRLSISHIKFWPIFFDIFIQNISILSNLNGVGRQSQTPKADGFVCNRQLPFSCQVTTTKAKFCLFSQPSWGEAKGGEGGNAIKCTSFSIYTIRYILGRKLQSFDYFEVLYGIVVVFLQ